MEKNKNFITIEGIDGAGKSTVMTYIEKYLIEHKIDFISTREPGGTEIAEAIRRLILAHYEERMYPDTELLLYFASRAQHIAEVIKPALIAGKWVLCDRFTDASYAYQGVGRNIPPERIAILENFVQGELRPDLTLILDVAPEVGLQRVSQQGSLDRLEAEQLDFFIKVRECYLDMAKHNPQRYKVIDANRSIADVERQIKQELDKKTHS
jgi:dTMP kinase